MFKALKMGVLGLALGLAGAVVLPASEAAATPKAPDSNQQCNLCKSACYLKYCGSSSSSAFCTVAVAQCQSGCHC